MPNPPLRYLVQPVSTQGHRFAVELHIDSTRSEPLLLSLPAWTPGSYMIRDFARNILCIEVRDEVGPLTLEKLDKQTWRLVSRGIAVRVRIEVYAWDLSVRAAHLDDSHGYFNGASLFLRVGGREEAPCQLEILRPSGDRYADWRLATSLKSRGADPFGFGLYEADDYEDLIDHPVEMGVFSLLPFSVRGVPHWLSLTGRYWADESRLQRDLSRICEAHAALFGELPHDRYLFLAQVTADGYGGLEHCYSSSLLCARDDLPVLGKEATTPGYRRLLGLCSHEYFHLWHVKRIRPRAFLGSGLGQEVHTRLLWVFEGITSYYDELALVRCGCIDEKEYLALLAEAVSRVLRNPGRRVQTLAESSFDAWTKFYRQDENSPNAIVSYYAKGALVALALDLLIRGETAGALSLDNVMRSLWVRYGRTGIGLEERGFEALAEEVTGLALGPFFHRALDTTEDLDLVGPLAAMGIGMRLRAALHAKDLGGLAEGAADSQAPPSLGIRLKPEGSEPMIAHVLTGGPALAAGLAPGDTLVACDGLRITRDNLDKLLQAGDEGREVEILAFRRDELQSRRVRLAPAPLDTCELWLLEDAPEESRERRAAWLGLGG